MSVRTDRMYLWILYRTVPASQVRTLGKHPLQLAIFSLECCRRLLLLYYRCCNFFACSVAFRVPVCGCFTRSHARGISYSFLAVLTVNCTPSGVARLQASFSWIPSLPCPLSWSPGSRSCTSYFSPSMVTIYPSLTMTSGHMSPYP